MSSFCFIAGLLQLQRQARDRQSKAFAPGTNRNHLSYLRLFLAFTVFYQLPAFPASLHALLYFVEFLTLSYSTPKAVTNALAAVKLQHERLGLPLGLFHHFQVRMAVRSLPRTMRVAPSPAPPFPPHLLQPLLEAARALGIWALPFRALVLLAFFTFARLSSLVPPGAGSFDPSRHPTVADLFTGDGGAFLRIKYSKTRQAADGGFCVPLLPSSELPCPVALAGELLQWAAARALPPRAPLFAASAASAVFPAPLTQPQARVFLASCLARVGVAPSAFSFHSFRRGGCSFAFARGALESDLALHGDWRSEAVRSYYPAGLARARVAQVLAGPPSLS